MKDWLRNIFKDKKGMGTVEVILIIVGIFTPNSRYILCRYSGNSGNRETV